MKYTLNLIQHIFFRATGAKITPILIAHDKHTTTFESVIHDRGKHIPFNFTFQNKNELTNLTKMEKCIVL
jgi:hypothetical protein